MPFTACQNAAVLIQLRQKFGMGKHAHGPAYVATCELTSLLCKVSLEALSQVP